MYICDLLAVFRRDTKSARERECPARGREKYSADDILRLRTALRAVRLDMDSRYSSMSVAVSLLMENINRILRDYNWAHADAALFFTRNGYPVTEQILGDGLEIWREAQETGHEFYEGRATRFHLRNLNAGADLHKGALVSGQK